VKISHVTGKISVDSAKFLGFVHFEESDGPFEFYYARVSKDHMKGSIPPKGWTLNLHPLDEFARFARATSQGEEGDGKTTQH
jgi:hypothetical protein